MKPGPAISTRRKETAVQIEGGNHSLGDLARCLVERAGAHHGKVGGDVAVFGVGRGSQR